MIPQEEFKKLLGKEAEDLTDEQILGLQKNMETFADIAFDLWLEDRKKKIK